MVAVVVECVIIASKVADELKDDIDTTPEPENKPEENVNKPKEGERNLPIEGEPNSDIDLYDENGLKQTRHYDSSGKAEYDIDHRHQNSHNNHKFPHKHIWDWTNPSNPRRLN